MIDPADPDIELSDKPYKRWGTSRRRSVDTQPPLARGFGATVARLPVQRSCTVTRAALFLVCGALVLALVAVSGSRANDRVESVGDVNTTTTVVDLQDEADAAALLDLIERDWQLTLLHYPELATRGGEPGAHNGECGDWSLDSFVRWADHNYDMWTQALALHRPRRSGNDTLAIDLDVFTRAKEASFRSVHDWYTHLMPLTPVLTVLNPVTSMVETAGATTFAEPHDFAHYAARLSCHARQLDAVRDLLAEGIRLNRTSARPLLEEVRVVDDLRALCAEGVDPADTDFIAVAFASLPEHLSTSSVVAAARESAIAAVRDDVCPAMRRLATYVESTYLPAARTTMSLGEDSALPNGLAFYRDFLLPRATTLSRHPKHVSAMADTEIEHIWRRLQVLLGELAEDSSHGYEVRRIPGHSTEWDLDHFDAQIKLDTSNPAVYAQSADDLLAAASTSIGRLHAILADTLFLPDVALLAEPACEPRVVAMSLIAELESNHKVAHYDPTDATCTRHPTVEVDTDDRTAFGLYRLDAVMAHETWPGHHLQTRRADRNVDLPPFRRDCVMPHSCSTAYTEGWAMYAEQLAAEAGAFNGTGTATAASPLLAYYGYLVEDMLRAMRMSLDPKVHMLGMSVDDAVEYMTKFTPLSAESARAEVFRLYAEPGVGASFKTGHLILQELRNQASETFGRTLDMRAFHELLLAPGPVSLERLQQITYEWRRPFERTPVPPPPPIQCNNKLFADSCLPVD